MTTVHCSVEECKHNLNGTCQKSDIVLDGNIDWYPMELVCRSMIEKEPS